MTELASLYKQAEEMVLSGYATLKDDKGRSQSWKLDAIKQDRISNRRSGIVDIFVAEVEATVDRLQKTVEEVKQQEEILSKLVGQTPQVETKHPPIQNSIPPNNANLGIDLDWN